MCNNNGFPAASIIGFGIELVNSKNRVPLPPAKIKAVSISNGWLELDSVYDYELYQKLYSSNDLIKFIFIKSFQ